MENSVLPYMEGQNHKHRPKNPCNLPSINVTI